MLKFMWLKLTALSQICRIILQYHLYLAYLVDIINNSYPKKTLNRVQYEITNANYSIMAKSDNIQSFLQLHFNVDSI